MLQSTKYFRQIYVFIIENLSHWREKEKEREREREREYPVIVCLQNMIELNNKRFLNWLFPPIFPLACCVKRYALLQSLSKNYTKYLLSTMYVP